MCECVKGIARSSTQRIITHLCSSPELYGAFQFLSAHCFGFSGLQLYCFGSVVLLSLALFPVAVGCCFQQKSLDKPTVRYLPSIRQQTDKVNDYLTNIAEHLEAKEPGISFKRWWRPKQS